MNQFRIKRWRLQLVNTLLQNGFSNPHLSRYNPVSLSYQCLNPDTIWSTINVNQDTNTPINQRQYHWARSHTLSMSQLGHDLKLSMPQLGHDLELSMPQLGHDLANYQCLNQDTILTTNLVLIKTGNDYPLAVNSTESLLGFPPEFRVTVYVRK